MKTAAAPEVWDLKSMGPKWRTACARRMVRELGPRRSKAAIDGLIDVLELCEGELLESDARYRELQKILQEIWKHIGRVTEGLADENFSR